LEKGKEYEENIKTLTALKDAGAISTIIYNEQVKIEKERIDALAKSINLSTEELKKLNEELNSETSKFEKWLEAGKKWVSFEGTEPGYYRAPTWHYGAGGHRYAGGVGSAETKETRLDDFIMRPGQKPVSFSPNDTIIGTKEGMAGRVFNISIGNIYGVNADQVAWAMQKRLERMITT
jgi:hypothetical protein